MVINGLIFKSDKIILFFEMKMFVFPVIWLDITNC